MSYLLPLLRQIKATETIKKTTNAMRMIAMSNHMRLRQDVGNLKTYQQELETSLATLVNLGASLEQTPTAPTSSTKQLCIIIGSQKGLCGTFNNRLAIYAKEKTADLPPCDFLVVGKQMRDTIRYFNIEPIIAYDEFTQYTLPTIAKNIAQLILSPTYQAVHIFFTEAQTFFIHAPTQKTFKRQQYQIELDNPNANPYNWDQTYQQTINTISTLTLNAQIKYLLGSSLLSEAAARFISMDSATRNADDLIATMRLNYNKLRQTAITRELIDLSGSFAQ